MSPRSGRTPGRDDGPRLFSGALPTLIHWGAPHPGDGRAAAGVRLRSLALSHPRAGDLAAALQAIGLAGIPVDAGAPNLRAVFDTPRGTVTLDSRGI